MMVRGILCTFGWIMFIVRVKGMQLVALDNVNVTSGGLQLEGWDKQRVIDGRSGNATHCNCCTAIHRPAWMQLDLKRTYFLELIEIFGRTDGANEQFQNLEVKLGFVPGNLENQALTRNGSALIKVSLRLYTAVQFIRIEGLTPLDVYMTICEIKAYQQTENNIITPNMKTTQSNAYENCIARNAIDGQVGLETYDANNSTTLCSMCSVIPDNGPPPWWQLDIGSKVLAHSVRVYGRRGLRYHSDQSADLEVFVSNVSLQFDNFTHVGHIDESGIMNGTLLFFNLRIFQFLTIRRWTPSILTLCEVEVYHAECPPGKYGLLCKACENCKNSVCNTSTGNCTLGCDPGWNPPMCITECDDGKYGLNCALPCSEHCSDSRSCNKVDGTCTEGCRPGFDFKRNPTCTIECEEGKYGLTCSQECSPNCLASRSCNNVDGTCNGGCRSGFDFLQNATCILECDDVRFGLNCAQNCSHNCFVPRSCNKTDGACIGGCLPGYDFHQNVHCTLECGDGLYGLNCSKTCSQHCSNSCSKVNGTCNGGCLPGYDFQTNSTCILECDDGKFGLNCLHSCSQNCIDPHFCNKPDGSCVGGCLPGFNFQKNTTCNSECEDGQFGINCSQACSQHCSKSCNKVNGTCNGGCLPGYDFQTNWFCNAGSFT